MQKPAIYIDGQEGTTGLRIRQMLAGRDDVEVLLIPPEHRRDRRARAEFLNRADLSVLCLPDDAAAEALALLENPQTKVIDTSTVRRVHPEWVYGLPEISPEWVYGLPEISPAHKEQIRRARRVANCGCYPVGFILAVRPLILEGLLLRTAPLVINAVSGYSGGGRTMIAEYEGADDPKPFCLYGLDGDHKHLPEMWKFSGCEKRPLFVPSVDHSFCGMVVSTPVPAEFLGPPRVTREDVYEVWCKRYKDCPFVKVVEPQATVLRDDKFLDLTGLSHTNFVELSVWGDPDQGLVLVGRLDNLGKGAAGNAVQCLNLMLGRDETAGLR